MKRKESKKEKHFSVAALKLEWKLSKDKKSPGLDKISPVKFEKKLDSNLLRISKSIYSGDFGFKKLRIVPIPKGNGKDRIICIPTVEDRLVQRVIVRLLTKDKNDNKKYLSKKLELENNPIIYGMGSDIREGSGVQDALKHAIKIRKHFPWALKTDIQSFFDTIDREYLITEFKKRFQNTILTRIVEKVIRCEAYDKDPKTALLLNENGIKKGVGLRQGMPLSPLLSNFFLRKFDKTLREKIGEDKAIRYADDIIVFGKTEDECKYFKNIIEAKLKDIGLEIPSLLDVKSKTKIVPPNESVTFLGIEIYRGRNGEYGQNIDPEKCKKIEDDFRSEFTFGYAIQNGLTLSQLLQRFDSKKRGYEDVYKGTDNLDHLKKNLNEIKQSAQREIMKNIFGNDVFDNLSLEQKQFLGFENQTPKPNSKKNFK